MLVLDSTSKSITALLSASPTTNPDFVATYADATSDSFTESASDGALNGTTAVTLVAAPASGVRRVVREIIIYNRNTSSVTLTVRYVNGANTRVLWSGTLQPAETWTLSRHVLSMSNWQHIGSAAPTTSDDSTKGFVIGSRWIDITNGQVYVCVKATAGAVWRNVTSVLCASDGSPDPAVSVDATGRVTMAYQPCFFAYLLNTQSNVTGDGTTVEVVFDTEVYDIGNNFGSNVFTAPADGKYLLKAQVICREIAAGHTISQLYIVTSNRTYVGGPINPQTYGVVYGYFVRSLIVIADMEAADIAKVTFSVSGSTKVVDLYGSIECHFCGAKLT